MPHKRFPQECHMPLLFPSHVLIAAPYHIFELAVILIQRLISLTAST